MTRTVLLTEGEGNTPRILHVERLHIHAASLGTPPHNSIEMLLVERRHQQPNQYCRLTRNSSNLLQLLIGIA